MDINKIDTDSYLVELVTNNGISDSFYYYYVSSYPKLDAPDYITWLYGDGLWRYVNNREYYTFELYDNLGHKIMNSSTQSLVYDFNDYSIQNGYYFKIKTIAKSGYRNSVENESPFRRPDNFTIRVETYDIRINEMNSGGYVRVKTDYGSDGFKTTGYEKLATIDTNRHNNYRKNRRNRNSRHRES